MFVCVCSVTATDSGPPGQHIHLGPSAFGWGHMCMYYVCMPLHTFVCNLPKIKSIDILKQFKHITMFKC